MSGGFELLLSGADASSAARHAIAASNPSLSPTLRDDLALLVTELVTNAVRHGGAASDRLSERWGVHPVPSGKCVWFELPAEATP